jgi:hypothetical protein
MHSSSGLSLEDLGNLQIYNVGYNILITIIIIRWIGFEY